MIDKTFKGDFYDGSLKELKEELIMDVPPGKTWYEGGGKGLIGNPTGLYDQYPTPHIAPPSYIEISFPNKYIHPTHYFLEGRRTSEWGNFLKSWEFEGKSINGEWKILHSQTDKVFSMSEKRFYPIHSEDVFIGFRINMTGKDSIEWWALCLGQIEIFGNIYESIPSFTHHFAKCHTIFNCFHIIYFIFFYIFLLFHLS